MIIGWVFFRADNVGMAVHWLATMFYPVKVVGQSLPGQTGLIVLLPIAAVVAHFCRNTWEIEHKWSMPVGVAMTILFLAALLTITAGQQSPFLYFQF